MANATSDRAAIDAVAIERWLGQRAPLEPPLAVRPLEGGFSNLTFLLEDRAGTRWVLRRPPTGNVLFAHWKIACISEGVYSRYSAGVMGDTDVDRALVARHPLARAEAADDVLRGDPLRRRPRTHEMGSSR